MPVLVAAALQVTRAERGELERMARSSTLPHRTVVQARGLLLAADGVANNQIARECDTTPDTVQFRSGIRPIQNSPADQRFHHEFSVADRSTAPVDSGMCVVTHVDVPPPRKDETEILLRSLSEQSRNEDGCLRYDVFQQNAPRLNHFTVFAVWRDEKTFAAHEAQPHTRQFREKLGPMLGAPYDERWYTELR